MMLMRFWSYFWTKNLIKIDIENRHKKAALIKPVKIELLEESQNLEKNKEIKNKCIGYDPLSVRGRFNDLFESKFFTF